MKTLILYKSRDGSTKEYAQWLHEVVKDSVLKNVDDFNVEELKSYDRIVIGSRTYMNKIGVQDFMKQNWSLMKDKKVYLFSVGMVDPNSAESKQSYERLSPEVKDGLAGYTKLPGRIKIQGLNFFEKLIMRLRGGKEKGKTDRVEKEALRPVLAWMNKM